ncbi:hypothetical protein ACHAWF_018428 [Thalassiosira exigua]
MAPPAINRNRAGTPTKPFVLKLSALIASLAVLRAASLARRRARTPDGGRGACVVSYGGYEGSVRPRRPDTLDDACLVESPWMRVARHAVRLPGGKGVVDDWLWIDYHDRINALVEAPQDAPADEGEARASPSSRTSGERFLILSQEKYALDGPSLAVVGGIVEPGEDATDAARREVREELSVSCEDWKAMGKFRTDVTRGMGWVGYLES